MSLLQGAVSVVIVVITILVLFVLWSAYGDVVSPWHVAASVKILIGIAAAWISFCIAVGGGILATLVWNAEKL